MITFHFVLQIRVRLGIKNYINLMLFKNQIYLFWLKSDDCDKRVKIGSEKSVEKIKNEEE